jgi:hypothetical protein
MLEDDRKMGQHFSEKTSMPSIDEQAGEGDEKRA